MKITKKICREVRIYNDWEYANPNRHEPPHHPYLYYSPAETGRLLYISAAWCIAQHGKKLSDFWRDNGVMHITVNHREEKPVKFVEALVWMRTKFGYREIVKTPMGSWMEKSFVEQRNKEIEEKYKALKSQTGAE